MVSGRAGISSKSPRTACIWDLAEARFSSHSKVCRVRRRVYLSGTDVAWGEHVLQLVGQQQLLELVRHVHRPLGDVQVTDDEHKLKHR